MERTLLIAGGSGMVGREVTALLQKRSNFERIVLLTRRKTETLPDTPPFFQLIVDFDDIERYGADLKCSAFISMLGTTAKKAGSADEFVKVDYGYPERVARIALSGGADSVILISSVGADASSRFLYTRTKGKLERKISGMGFRSVNILRPSLLLGRREEYRPGEKLAKYLSYPISCMTPFRYRPVKASVLAEKIVSLSENPAEGVNIFEGRSLYRI